MIEVKQISEFFERDLQKLKEEISLYENESDIWQVKNRINNSAGNLCLHICGNLQHFIGAILGNSGYVRHRDNEFGLKNIQRLKLISEIDTTISAVKSTLEKMSPADFEKEYPAEVMNRKWRTDQFLIHLLTHLNYHLGQVNYHRRLI